MGEPLSIGIALSDVVIRRRSEPQPSTIDDEMTRRKRDDHFMAPSVRQEAGCAPRESAHPSDAALVGRVPHVLAGAVVGAVAVVRADEPTDAGVVPRVPVVTDGAIDALVDVAGLGARIAHLPRATADGERERDARGRQDDSSSSIPISLRHRCPPP
jgi:hypothetical protein